jgi:hypothetical protein
LQITAIISSSHNKTNDCHLAFRSFFSINNRRKI